MKCQPSPHTTFFAQAIACAAAFSAAPSLAATIGRETLSPAAIVEGFEGLADHGNLAIEAPFQFASGVTLTSPAAGNYGSFGPYIVEGGFFGLYPQQIVPVGRAYLGQANPRLFTGPIEFTFPQPVHRVGAFVCIDGPMDFEIFGVDGQLLETQRVNNVSFDDWPTNFVAVQQTEPIAKVRYNGYGGGVLRIDELTWEPVPEPSARLLAAACFCGLLVGRSDLRRGDQS